MATTIYLGLPPSNVVKWIKDNYKPDIDMSKVPLNFTANEDNSSVSLVCYNGDFVDSWCKLDYSMDGKSWNTYIDPDSADETLHKGKIINLNKDETVYFRATLGNVQENPNLNGFFDSYTYMYHQFVMEGSIKADGNIQFLLENTGTKMDVPEYCYYSIFQNCTSLTQAPALPATELANYCYLCMFYDCTNLNNINVNFSDWNTSGATENWVYNVSSSGTFTCPADLPEEYVEGEFDCSKIPTGWTVVRK